MRTSDDRLYRRKLNEFDQQLKRLQKELAKLKVLKREGGRARKQLARAMQREMELAAVLDDEQAAEFECDQIRDNGTQHHCKKCRGRDTLTVNAGSRLVIVCQECGGRHTVEPRIAESA